MLQFNMYMKPKKLIHHHFIALLFMLIIPIFVIACQKSSPEVYPEAEQKSAEPYKAPNLTETCQNLEREMQNIDHQRSTLALEQVNQNIRLCLALADFNQQKKLMRLANQMYRNFLHVERPPEQQTAFENYALEKSQYPTIQQQYFDQLNPRDQYLLRHQGQAYIELIDLDRHEIFYRRSPQYLAKVFAPYLPSAESVFILELADQNRLPVFQDHHLKLAPQDIVQRAQFWLKYQKDYPQSSYRADANYLAQYYMTLLFIGSKNDPISTQFNGADDIQDAVYTEIVQLAEQKGILALKAKRFLNFIEMSPAQRQHILGTPANISNQQPHEAQNLLILQLQRHLNLDSIDPDRPAKRDCFRDAICV